MTLWLLAPFVAVLVSIQEPPRIDPVADRLLREASEYLQAEGQFSFVADVTYDRTLSSGEKIQLSASVAVSMRRPDHLHGSFLGDLNQWWLWFDGKNLSVMDMDARTYSISSIPGTIDGALDHSIAKHDLSLPFADLLFSDPYKTMISNVSEGKYLGLHSVRGMPCHHLAFREDLIDWQIWIEEGKRVLPRKLVITYKKIPGSPQYTSVVTEWDFSTRLAERLFRFEPPPDAKKVESLREGGGK